MKAIHGWYVFWAMLFALSACSRKASDQSTLHFTTPANPNALAKTSNAKLSKDAANFCYLVNITGGGLAETKFNCAPTQGVSTGFVAPSTDVQISVSKGAGREVELYGYIPVSGSGCDATKSLNDVPVNRLFRMDFKTDVDMTADSVNVDLTAAFPGVNDHWGIQGALPLVCYANLPPIPVILGVGSPLQIGQHYMVRSEMGSVSKHVQSGTHYSVTGGVSNVIQ